MAHLLPQLPYIDLELGEGAAGHSFPLLAVVQAEGVVDDLDEIDDIPLLLLVAGDDIFGLVDLLLAGSAEGVEEGLLQVCELSMIDVSAMHWN